MINESSRILDEGFIKNPHYLDMAMIMGAGFPAFRGGILKYADSIGTKIIHEKLARLTEKNARFEPSKLLSLLARSNAKFYDTFDLQSNICYTSVSQDYFLRIVCKKVIEEESKNGNVIITTAEELKIYHAIKTILIHKKEIDSDRISYRDQKNSFNILVDDNNKKIICKITSSKNKHYIELNGVKYEVNGIDSIVAIKKQLLDFTMQYFQK
jgi:hypothetical protein